MTLDQLPRRSRAVVVAVGGSGPERRLLLELGLLPGAEVTPELTSPLGDPTAYRVRGCLVALRRAQARTVTVQVAEVRG